MFSYGREVGDARSIYTHGSHVFVCVTYVCVRRQVDDQSKPINPASGNTNVAFERPLHSPHIAMWTQVIGSISSTVRTLRHASDTSMSSRLVCGQLAQLLWKLKVGSGSNMRHHRECRLNK